ncbi:MAG: hypothetical protein M5U34_06200 [Chloroflexi bacterium]|nr:hypothetical protein [Chloroflexota bacterium]
MTHSSATTAPPSNLPGMVRTTACQATQIDGPSPGCSLQKRVVAIAAAIWREIGEEKEKLVETAVSAPLNSAIMPVY